MERHNIGDVVGRFSFLYSPKLDEAVLELTALTDDEGELELALAGC